MAVLILMLLAQAGGLNWAVKHGDLGAARAFLAAGADPNYRDSFLSTPLHHAVLNDRADMVAILLDHHADASLTSFGYTPLYYAVYYNRADLTVIFLDHKADVNGLILPGGPTPLDLAVRRGYAPLAKLLIDRGADVRAADSDGITPLHIAAIMGKADLVRLLLEKGADPNARNAGGGFGRCYTIRREYRDRRKISESLSCGHLVTSILPSSRAGSTAFGGYWEPI